ncbi:hypothetical protein C7S15_3239 [Burkholderia cepacia]|uniref:hypothetical protein n=1 Tax=Burkholderia cepacia TaxID=292 RepID=UPI00298F59D3|nr:hypothetical protein [Burkholderia cepacia]MDW9228642.1 hypothetical protein [Burkholderia cepacia]
MSDLNAAPSSTEPTAEELASIAMGTNAQEAGGAAAGEIAGGAVGGETGASAVDAGQAAIPSEQTGDAPAIGGGVDAPSHLLLLDAMLAEIERKIAAGIHLFAHEVTVARDHLAKLL